MGMEKEVGKEEDPVGCSTEEEWEVWLDFIRFIKKIKKSNKFILLNNLKNLMKEKRKCHVCVRETFNQSHFHVICLFLFDNVELTEVMFWEILLDLIFISK